MKYLVVPVLLLAILMVRSGLAVEDDSSGTVRPPGAGTDLSALIATAEQALQVNDARAALKDLRAVLKQDPRHRPARLMVSSALLILGRPVDAGKLLEELMVEEPGNFAVLNNLAWLLATTMEPAVRDPARAIELARQALLNAPSNYSVWSTLSEAYYQSGLYDKALRAAIEARDLSMAQSVPGERVVTYVEQVNKCQQAVHAFSLMER